MRTLCKLGYKSPDDILSAIKEYRMMNPFTLREWHYINNVIVHTVEIQSVYRWSLRVCARGTTNCAWRPRVTISSASTRPSNSMSSSTRTSRTEFGQQMRSGGLLSYLSMNCLLNGVLSYSQCYFVRIQSISQKFNSCVTDGRTDGPTDGPTDRHTLL